MLTEPTLDRLRALRLGAMADAYRTQLQDPAIGALSFDERVGLLVDAEHLSRDNRKLARRLKEAKLRIAAGVSRGSRLRAAPRTRSGADPPARHRSVDRRTPQRPHHRRDRRRQDLPGVRAGPARLSAGLPGDLPALAALLSGTRARARRRLLHDACSRGSRASTS